VLTKKLGADFGIVISASHNPYPDNGIKFSMPRAEALGRRRAAIEAELDCRP
jgi:phosphomannomutase